MMNPSGQLRDTLPQRVRRQPSVRPASNRRQHVKFACFPCQKKKTKCDGVRPVCGACVKRNDAECKYPVREGAISRYSELKTALGQLERENQELKELLAYVQSQESTEALDLFNKLRTTANPLSILTSLKKTSPPLGRPVSATSEAVLRLDAEALTASVDKMPARPWTSVAGDGLVSHLLSASFRADDPCLSSFVDRELFVRDMRQPGQRNCQFCSPFLVNALCAFRSLFSRRAQRLSRVSGIDLTAQFLAEAKQHMEIEAGRLCLTTAQGLYMMYLTLCRQGSGRAGYGYRLAALDMLRRLDPTRALTRPWDQAAGTAEKRRALSTVYWGIFTCESFCAQSYLQPPPIELPSFPYLHDDSSGNTVDTDVYVPLLATNSPSAPVPLGTSSAMNQISALQYRVLKYNSEPRGPVGDEMDMRVRRDLFFQLAALEASFPSHLRYRENLTPQTIHLKRWINLVAFNILRPLPADTLFQPTRTTNNLLFDLYALDLDLVSTYLSHWGLAESSPLLLFNVFNGLFTVLPFLNGNNNSKPDADEKSRAWDLFTRGCRLLHRLHREVNFDANFARMMLSGVLALEWKMGWKIPDEARVYCEQLVAGGGEPGSTPKAVEENRDEPGMDFAVPVSQDVQKQVLGDGVVRDEGAAKLDLATVLGEWFAAMQGGADTLDGRQTKQ